MLPLSVYFMDSVGVSCAATACHTSSLYEWARARNVTSRKVESDFILCYFLFFEKSLLKSFPDFGFSVFAGDAAVAG